MHEKKGIRGSLTIFDQRTKKQRKIWEDNTSGTCFCHYSPRFCVKKDQRSGEKLLLSQNNPKLGGVEGVEPLSSDHVLNLTLLLRKGYKKPGTWTGFPRPHGETEKKASQKREKADCLKNNSVFVRCQKASKPLILSEKQKFNERLSARTCICFLRIVGGGKNS